MQFVEFLWTGVISGERFHVLRDDFHFVPRGNKNQFLLDNVHALEATL